MAIEIVIIPCLSDNYAYIIHDKAANKNTLVDAPEFEPISACLEASNWNLDNILITHHHQDHIAGVEELYKKFRPLIFGAKADAHRLPRLDLALEQDEKFSVGSLIFKCIEVPGHTLGHIAFYCASEKILFSGDSLMTLGCGRLFEGTAEEMLTGLDIMRSLPEETAVYSGHEYAEQNANFAITIEPENKDLINRSEKIFHNVKSKSPNVPVSIKLEKQTNPFLRCDVPEVMKLPMFEHKTKLEIFSALRSMKDNF